jgi:hypothetical protein
MIRTNAPTGYARTPYSVSPRLKLHSFGPMKRKNWVAFMPVHFAVAKCPSSWKKMQTISSTTKTNAHQLHAASSPSSATITPIPITARMPPVVSSAFGSFSLAPPARISSRNLW